MSLRPDKDNRLKSIPQPAIIISIIGLLILIIGASIWLVQNSLPHSGQPVAVATATKSVPTAVQISPTPSATAVSPLIFGTNLALFDTNDQVLNSEATRTALHQMHISMVRMPFRSSLSEATEIQTAQIIKDMGASALVALHGPGATPAQVAENIRMVKDMNNVFGNNIVYYEYGNEADLHQVTAEAYAAAWNIVIPQLKSNAKNAHFVGPVNYHYNRQYITTFLHNAQPRPDEISWHEYTCSPIDPETKCISHIDNWTTHINDARASMISAIGSAVPIMITEWNYAPNATTSDGKSNNPAFLTTWTTKALQTLAANRIYASMQYSCTNTIISLVNKQNVVTPQGSALQTQYEDIIVNGHQPAPTTSANPTAPNPTPNTGVTNITGQGFTFADGTTNGWTSHDPTIMNVQNAPSSGINGKRALQMTIGLLKDNAYPSIDAKITAQPPQPGQTVSADVYINSNSITLMAKLYVIDSNNAWHTSNPLTLTPGSWTRLTYTIPASINGQAKRVGLQFNSPGGSGSNADVFVNAVTWA